MTIRERPTISFDLETVVRYTHTESMSASDMLNRLREVGIRCVALTRKSPHSALPLLEEHQLHFSDVHTALSTNIRKTEAIKQADAWAHVCSHKGVIPLAHAANARAIGVVRTAIERDALRAAHADTTIMDWQELVDYAIHSRAHSTKLAAAALLLSVDAHKFKSWRRHGNAPVTEDAFGRIRYPRTFIDGLLQLTRSEKPTVKQSALYTLEWAYTYGTHTERLAAVERIAHLTEEGSLLTAQQIGALLQQPPNHVAGWIRTKYLPAIMIRRTYYVPRRSVEKLQKILTMPTTAEVATHLGVHRETIRRWTAEGKISADMAPDGTMHFNIKDPRIVAIGKGMAIAKQDHLTSEDAAFALGIEQSTVQEWVRRGLLPVHRAYGILFIPAEHVAALHERFNQLPSDFAWMALSVAVKTYTPQQVSRLCGVETDTVRSWTRAGLLPFFNRTITSKRRAYYVSRYVDGLVCAAGGELVDVAIVRRYKETCMEARYIM